MAYEDFRDLPRRTACDKVLGDRAFNTAQNSKCDEYQRGLASIVYKVFIKKSSATRANKPAGASTHTVIWIWKLTISRRIKQTNY